VAYEEVVHELVPGGSQHSEYAVRGGIRPGAGAGRSLVSGVWV
jgi:hypothetical protein